MPVTFLYGGDTDWMNSGHGRRVVTRLRAEGKGDADIIIIPDAGHQVVLEDPKGFVSGVFTALARAPPRGAAGGAKVPGTVPAHH